MILIRQENINENFRISSFSNVLFPFSVSVAAINSNGLLEFSHPQQEQHQYITNQVPLENFKTGTTNSNLLVAAQSGKSNVSGATNPARETKGILRIFYD